MVALMPAKGCPARTLSFAYNGKNEDLATVGRTLGVASVLLGTARRVGNRERHVPAPASPCCPAPRRHLLRQIGVQRIGLPSPAKTRIGVRSFPAGASLSPQE